MKNGKINVGIIGLGVGERHLAAYSDVMGCQVTAICDIDSEKLTRIATQYQIQKRYVNYRPIVEDPDIDVISVCSYDDVHAQQCVEAFKNGKHVMVEKPLTLFRHEAEDVLRAQRDSGKLLTSNLILRQSPRFKSARRLVQDGDLGEVVFIEGDYLHEILHKQIEGWRGKMAFHSSIYSGGIHLIDLMRWILGQEVIEVATMGNKVLTQNTAYRFDDTFVSMFRFSEGALGKCFSSFGAKRTKFHSLNIYGSKKTFVNDIPDARLFSGDQSEDMDVLSNEQPAWRYPGMEKGDLIPDFIDAIREAREPNVSSRDVFRVMDICFAAREAAETGSTVKVDYLI